MFISHQHRPLNTNVCLYSLDLILILLAKADRRHQFVDKTILNQDLYITFKGFLKTITILILQPHETVF